MVENNSSFLTSAYNKSDPINQFFFVLNDNHCKAINQTGDKTHRSSHLILNIFKKMTHINAKSRPIYLPVHFQQVFVPFLMSFDSESWDISLEKEALRLSLAQSETRIWVTNLYSPKYKQETTFYSLRKLHKDFSNIK